MGMRPEKLRLPSTLNSQLTIYFIWLKLLLLTLPNFAK